jgi:HAE1 family hydrophobic/amphiphilic exporter-1
MVQVTTTFVGASATDVEASVATPLEQKINGVENGIYLKSTNANDGTLTLKVSFDVGSNLDMANVLTQNRVSEATPQLPQSVKNYGVAVKKALAFPLLVISIKSPNGTYDSSFLSNYTTINVNDNIARIPGVGQINLFGGSDYAMRSGSARPHREARDHRPGHRQSRSTSKISSPPRARSAAPPAVPGTEYTYTVRTQGRLLERRRVRRDRRPLEPRRVPGAAEGRGRARARHAALQLARPAQQQGRRPSSPSSRSPAPTRSTWRTRSRRRWPTSPSAFPRDMEYTISLDTTLPVTRASTRSSTRCSRRSFWSSSSSSSSSRTGGRP